MKSTILSSGLCVSCNTDFAIRENETIACWEGELVCTNHTDSHVFFNVHVEGKLNGEPVSADVLLGLQPMHVCTLLNDVVFNDDCVEFFGKDFIKNYVVSTKHRTTMGQSPLTPLECLPQYTHYMVFAFYELDTPRSVCGYRKAVCTDPYLHHIDELQVRNGNNSKHVSRYIPITSTLEEIVAVEDELKDLLTKELTKRFDTLTAAYGACLKELRKEEVKYVT